MNVSRRSLVWIIVTLALYVGSLHVRIWALHDSIQARDIDVRNCELDAADTTAPVPYLPARASMY